MSDLNKKVKGRIVETKGLSDSILLATQKVIVEEFI